MFDAVLDLIGVPNANSPVQGHISDEELERMFMDALQTGDRGRADRIRTIKKMRMGPTDPLLSQPAQAPAPAPHSVNPFSHINDALLSR